MIKVGRGYIVVLSTDMRSPVDRRPATTRSEALAAARDLLDEAERREWHRGEVGDVLSAER